MPDALRLALTASTVTGLRETNDYANSLAHGSLPDQAPNFRQNLLARNGLHLAGANLVSPTNCLRDPEALNLVGLGEIQALRELVRKPRPCGDWKLHRFLRQLLQCKWHNPTLPGLHDNLKPLHQSLMYLPSHKASTPASKTLGWTNSLNSCKADGRIDKC